MRFHVLPPPHAATNLEYISCAFTQKVLKWIRMFEPTTHDVFHYGNEQSQVDCTEHISVTTAEDLSDSLKWHIRNKGIDHGYNPLRDGFIFDRTYAILSAACSVR